MSARVFAMIARLVSSTVNLLYHYQLPTKDYLLRYILRLAYNS